MKTIAFFNNKGGVGKTSLVYHLSWMFSEMGIPVLAVDLDPQSNLTAMFLDENTLEKFWPDGDHPDTIFGFVNPILRGLGDIKKPYVKMINNNLGLIVGDLALSGFEDKLSEAWPKCRNGDESAFRITTAFHRIIEQGISWGAELVLIDVGPNLGAINRSALIASDYFCVPLSPDLFSLQGLRNLGPTMKEWRRIWKDTLKDAPEELSVPKGKMKAIGYIVMQHSIMSSRPVKAYLKWINRIPAVYRESVLYEKSARSLMLKTITEDKNCLKLLKHYRSLMPMAMEANKPIFFLKSADGAIGAHAAAVQDCYLDFKDLAGKILERVEYNDR